MYRYLLLLFVSLCFINCEKKTESTPFLITEETSIQSLHEMISSKEFSIESIVTAYLERIDSLDNHGPAINSIITINPDAIEIAKSLDQELKEKGKTRGALFGVPVILKDNISTADNMPTTAGSLALKDSFTGKDSGIAKQLREAGAIIIAKANLSEWANFRGENSTSGWSGYGGLTKNPYILSANTCGSSAGSGAAASANFSPLAIGTETNGSIVCPATTNGIVGLKPTVGLISRTGIIPISYTQDTAGPMAKSVTDVALSLPYMIAKDKTDDKTLTRPVGLNTNYLEALNDQALTGKRIGWHSASKGINKSVDSLMSIAIEELITQGAEVIEIEEILPDGTGSTSFQVMLMEYEDGLNHYFKNYVADSLIQSVEELIAFNKNNEVELQYFNQAYLEMAVEKPNMDSEEYKTMVNKALRLSQKEGIDKVMKENNLDAFIAPTGSPAWQTDLMNGDNYTIGTSSPAAISGYPNITVPMGFVGELPVGISFFAEAWSEAKLLGFAYDYEQATNHRGAPKFLDQ